MNKNHLTIGDMQNVKSNMAPWENYVSNHAYEKFETYVRDSSISLYRVKGMGELHFNVYKGSGEVERCNRLAIFVPVGCDSDEQLYCYLNDYDALNSPKIGQIVGAELHFIDFDDEDNGREYYWVDSITPINEDVKINLIDRDKTVRYDY